MYCKFEYSGVFSCESDFVESLREFIRFNSDNKLMRNVEVEDE